MKSLRFSLFSFFTLLIVASCTNTPASNPSEIIDTVKVTTKPEKKTPLLNLDTASLLKNATTSPYNNFARFIAGLPQKQKNNYSESEKDSLWIKYAQKLNSKWALMTARRTAKLNSWAAKEVPESMRESEVLFYPFSGADILNANLLFPKAKRFYLFGLEPVGFIPDIKNANKNDSLERYFNSLNASLNSLTNFSFFRTKSMKVDFKAEELNGTIHLLLLFLSRNGNTIADVHYVYIDENGVQQENDDRKVKKNDGVEIIFLDTAKTLHTVAYFEVNLDDSHLSKNQGMQTYIKGLGTCNTYLKAASYLMHNRSFSMIRSCIVKQSKYLLQDDSGVPFRFFTDKKEWETTLYGVYVPPIPLFANYYQADLDSAYNDSNITRKPLNFGIGYNFNKSNLMLFERK